MTKETIRLSKKFNAICAPNLHSDLITIEGKLHAVINSIGTKDNNEYMLIELAEALSLIRQHITLIEKENR